MNKKGSHIEIIISFVIFITFLIFIFVVIKPSLTVHNDKDNLIQGVEYSILENISEYMTIATVKLEMIPVGNCFELNNLLNDLDIGKNIIVKNSSDVRLVSNSDGVSLQITQDVSDDFFKIYYSQEFNEVEAVGVCTPVNYDKGFVKREKYVFESKIIKLIEEYNNYDGLKESFKLSNRIDFGYGIKLSNGTILETEEKNLSTSIYIKETPIKYINLNGNLEGGFLRTKIW